MFRSGYLYDLDSVNFALALERFDPTVHQPHPPGYFLYILLGRLVNSVVQDANGAFVAISVAASIGAAWALYALAEAWFGRRTAAIAVALFLFSPLCWFHGVVALTYVVECFFSALLGWLCWRVYSGQSSNVLPASIALGLAVGFRPSAILFLGPLWAVSAWRGGGKRFAVAGAALGTTVLAWFIPMMETAGGTASYFGALAHLWQAVPGTQMLAGSPLFAVFGRMLTIGWIGMLCLGMAVAAIALQCPREKLGTRAAATFSWIWVTPGLLFFSLVFLKFVNSGYLLVIAPPVFVWVARRVEALYGSATRRSTAFAVLGAGAALNVTCFLYAPMYCSHAAIRKLEADLAQIQRDIRQHMDPRTTLIVGFDAHFLGYRHAGYYLPEFLNVQYPEATYPDGRRIFAMRHGDTRILAALPLAGFDRFIFFPLPEGEEYDAYLETLYGRFAHGELRAATAGGRKLITGPVKALPSIFGSTVSSDPGAAARGSIGGRASAKLNQQNDYVHTDREHCGGG